MARPKKLEGEWNHHMTSEPPKRWYWGPEHQPNAATRVWYISSEQSWPEFIVCRGCFIRPYHNDRLVDCYVVRAQSGRIIMVSSSRVFLTREQAQAEAAVMNKFAPIQIG